MYAEGSSRSTSERRSSPSGRYAGSQQAITVNASRNASARINVVRERPRTPEERNRSSGPTSPTARRVSVRQPRRTSPTPGRRAEPGAGSVEESAVGTGTRLPGHLAGGQG